MKKLMVCAALMAAGLASGGPLTAQERTGRRVEAGKVVHTNTLSYTLSYSKGDFQEKTPFKPIGGDSYLTIFARPVRRYGSINKVELYAHVNEPHRSAYEANKLLLAFRKKQLSFTCTRSSGESKTRQYEPNKTHGHFWNTTEIETAAKGTVKATRLLDADCSTGHVSSASLNLQLHLIQANR